MTLPVARKLLLHVVKWRLFCDLFCDHLIRCPLGTRLTDYGQCVDILECEEYHPCVHFIECRDSFSGKYRLIFTLISPLSGTRVEEVTHFPSNPYPELLITIWSDPVLTNHLKPAQMAFFLHHQISSLLFDAGATQLYGL